MNHLVSIIVPAYNAERYLDECVRSILVQTRQNLQIILVDDGSTDGTPDLCDAWAKRDSRIEVVHQPNGGQPAARNSGYSKAKGDWIWFVDSDDLIAHDSVEVLLAAAETRDADLVVMNIDPFDEVGAVSRASLGLGSFPECASSDGRLFERLLFEGRIGHYAWSFFLKSSLLRQMQEGTGPFREGLRLLEDVVFAHELSRFVSDVAYVSEALYSYRQTPGSMLHSVNPHAARSGLQAVRLVRTFDSPPELHGAKNEMCCNLLFGIDAIAGYGKEAKALHSEIRSEILDICSEGCHKQENRLKIKCRLMKWHLFVPVRRLFRFLVPKH